MPILSDKSARQVVTGKTLLSGARVLDPASGLDAQRDVLVENGVIVAVDAPAQLKSAQVQQRIDLSGKVLVPGLLDIHVHLREPGQEWKETIATGARAAVAGGFTAVCCMPNTLPANDNASVTELILERAASANLCRVYPIGAITIGRKGEALAPLMELRDAGCVAFSDDGAPVYNSQIMRKALEYCLMLGAVLTVHEEDLYLSQDFVMNESALSLKLGLRGMPDAAETVMIARDIELARLTGGRVHFCHVSSARGVELIRRAKEEGIPVTAEVTPHNLVADERYVEDYQTNAKMSMPLRTEADTLALTQGLAEGVIDCVATDHAPHEMESKRVEFDAASFGTLGLQTALPLVLRRVREGKLSLMRAIESLSVSPAKCLGLNVPAIAQGKEADLTVIDLQAKVVHRPEHIFSKSKNSMFLGEELQGLAIKTFIGGRMVYDFSQQEE